MSYNAAKYQKTMGSRHGQACPNFPRKKRFRDLKEAKTKLVNYRYQGKLELEEPGETTFKQKRTYYCNACKGYHITSQDKM